MLWMLMSLRSVWAIEQNLVSESRDIQSPFPHTEESLHAGYLKIYRHMRGKVKELKKTLKTMYHYKN